MFHVLVTLSSDEAALLTAAMRASLASSAQGNSSDAFRIVCRKVLSALENAKLIVESERS